MKISQHTADEAMLCLVVVGEVDIATVDGLRQALTAPWPVPASPRWRWI